MEVTKGEGVMVANGVDMVEMLVAMEAGEMDMDGMMVTRRQNFKTCLFPNLNLLCSSSKKQNKQKTYDCNEQKK